MRDGQRGQGHKGKLWVAMWVKVMEGQTVGGHVGKSNGRGKQRSVQKIK